VLSFGFATATAKITPKNNATFARLERVSRSALPYPEAEQVQGAEQP
jgi:hypothetical protein